MSCCGIVATRRGKQTLGMSLEAVRDRASVGKQPKVLFQAGMMSFQKGTAQCSSGHADEYRLQLLMHKNDNQESFVSVLCLH